MIYLLKIINPSITYNDDIWFNKGDFFESSKSGGVLVPSDNYVMFLDAFFINIALWGTKFGFCDSIFLYDFLLTWDRSNLL